MRTHGPWSWILFLPLIASLGAAGCQRSEAARSKTPTPVRVRVVAEAAAGGGTRYSGSVEPAAKVDLAFKVGGYVRELAQVKVAGGTRKVQEGDFVTKGTVLAVLSQADYQQKNAAARAALAEAVASNKQAQLDYDRAKTLFDSNTISSATTS